MDARIGTLNDGSFYAFANGYDQPEVRGTLAQVEAALGAHHAGPTSALRCERYSVTLRFQHPAWDEVRGIVYNDVLARSKAEAVAAARTLARNDGHTGTGKGRITFTASAE